MRGMTSWKILLAISAGSLLLCSLSAEGMDTAFSYQGRLTDGGSPANGAFDFRFFLYNAEAGGSQIGATLYGDNIPVNDGLFTVQLDFGSGTFDGNSLWLEVGVRPGASTGTYTPLVPRHAILPSPYALHSGTIEMGAVGSAEVSDNSLTASDLAPNSVTASELATGAVGSAEVSDNSLTASDLAPNSVTVSELASNSVTSNDILNGTITSSDTNVNSVQARVAGVCGTNRSIKSIGTSGNVVCEYDDFNSVGYTTVYSASAINGATNWAVMSGPNMVCFLTGVHFRDVDDGSEDVWCNVSYGLWGSTYAWILEAYSEDDADAWCEMRCLTWSSR